MKRRTLSLRDLRTKTLRTRRRMVAFRTCDASLSSALRLCYWQGIFAVATLSRVESLLDCLLLYIFKQTIKFKLKKYQQIEFINSLSYIWHLSIEQRGNSFSLF